jgi:hypothetical protein
MFLAFFAATATIENKRKKQNIIENCTYVYVS